MPEITVAQAALALGLHPRSVTRYLVAGRLKGRQLTRRMWLVDARSVARFVPDPPGRKPGK